MFVFRWINTRGFLTRGLSSKESFIDLFIDKGGIALLSMKRPPVNAMNVEMLQDISSSVDVVQKNKCKGMVITSAVKVFSAGLDLNEFYEPDVQRLRTFWSTLQDLFLKIYGCGETTATVAINGYTAAGGCVLALLCDYRVMVSDEKAKIGVNDTMVGIVPGPWVSSLMTRTVGHRQAEITLTASTMYTAEEALKINLIDELAINKEDAIEKCKQFIRRYDNIPTRTKARTKMNLRGETVRLVEENREVELKSFIDDIFNPYTREKIELYMNQLKSKHK